MTIRPAAAEPAAALAFTADELAAVAAALAALGTRMSRAALSAARKVVAAEPTAVLDTMAQPLARVIPLRPGLASAPTADADDEIVQALEQAIHDRRVVRIVYTDGRGRPSDREIEPAGIMAAAGHRYLIGWCRTRGEGRGFRLDRVIAAKVTSEPVPVRALADILGPLAQHHD